MRISKKIVMLSSFTQEIQWYRAVMDELKKKVEQEIGREDLSEEELEEYLGFKKSFYPDANISEQMTGVRHLYHARQRVLLTGTDLLILQNDGRAPSDEAFLLHLEQLRLKVPSIVVWTPDTLLEDPPSMAEQEMFPGVVHIKGKVKFLVEVVCYLLWGNSTDFSDQIFDQSSNQIL